MSSRMVDTFREFLCTCVFVNDQGGNTFNFGVNVSMEPITVTRGEYLITTDKNKIDVGAVHDFLSKQSYWCKHIPYEFVQRSVDNSLNFGLFHGDKQIGFARVVTDYATIAYLGDVYILPEYRGKGFSKWLMEQVMIHPGLQGLRRWMLRTSDAHELYRKFGWTDVSKPESQMEIFNPNVYTQDL